MSALIEIWNICKSYYKKQMRDIGEQLLAPPDNKKIQLEETQKYANSSSFRHSSNIDLELTHPFTTKFFLYILGHKASLASMQVGVFNCFLSYSYKQILSNCAFIHLSYFSSYCIMSNYTRNRRN